MILERIGQVETFFLQLIREQFGIELPHLVVESPRLEFGDLAFPFPFELAKHLRRSPRQIAGEVVQLVQKSGKNPPGVQRVEAAGAGYINVFFDRPPFFKALRNWLEAGACTSSLHQAKVVVEHTNINPNKAAHIGHLRNAVLGDTFVRLLRASGDQVEVQNYIDNTGVQVADVVVGFQHLRQMSLKDIEQVPEPFDYYCWDLYAQVSDWYAKDSSHLNHRYQTLAEIEEGRGETAQIAEHISMRIVQAHLNTMLRVGVHYDVLPRESEILHLHFWEEAFEQLKKRRAIEFRLEGPNAGCWVMKLQDADQEEEKIIVRSNGTITYVGKDIAYQLWKFGLLDKNFHYRPFFQYPDGETVWISSASHLESKQPDFGKARFVYNVIDVRQSYLQKVVVQALRSLGFEEEASRSIHFSYEMVALAPRCCAEMGIELSDEERRKAYVEVSGRKGLGVKADDLINQLISRSFQEVSSRQPELPKERRELLARQIAVGALRYFLLKYARNSVIAFDFSEALNFEGETGPYLQYSVVRANNIFQKLQAQAPTKPAPEGGPSLSHGVLDSFLSDPQIWGLLLQAARLEDVVRQSIQTLEISYLAKYAFTLAQQFNLFYHRYHILSEEDPSRKKFYVDVAEVTRAAMLKGLNLL
ncbi:MAG: arginine--tRNA ligase, partial [Acidobacteria bacterium]|nr:arginine--tRNA ligase [Acidobacteriota bacterium]